MMTSQDGLPPDDEEIAREATRSQAEYFMTAQPRCRVMQLPEGVMLRYTRAEALYFYLRTGTTDGRIVTAVFASDSPYDPRKTTIGDVSTPMFESNAETIHLKKIQNMLTSWVDFVAVDPDTVTPFTAYGLGETDRT
jgi:hypothetical protein